LVLKHLFEKSFRFRSYVHGGRKKHSVTTYVDQHRGKEYVAHVDIRNFYPSVKRDAVMKALQACGCTNEIANLITDLTWLQGYGLPQGASTSTILANAVLKPIYRSIQRLSSANGLRFASLNDDLILSADHDFGHVYGQVIQIVKRHGYQISSRKSGIMGPTDAQVVAGRKLNKSEVTPPRGWMRELSAQVEAIITSGPKVVASAAGISVRALKNKIRGSVGYLSQVNSRLGGVLRRKLRVIGWYF
jgi:RNA-directed DNA polymerase